MGAGVSPRPGRDPACRPVFVCSTSPPLRTQLPPTARRLTHTHRLFRALRGRGRVGAPSDGPRSGPGRRFCFLSPSSLALQNGDQRSREVRPPAEQLGKGGRDPHLQPPDRQCLRQSGEWALVHLRSHPPPWVPRGRRLHLGLSRTEGGYPWGLLKEAPTGAGLEGDPQARSRVAAPPRTGRPGPGLVPCCVWQGVAVEPWKERGGRVWRQLRRIWGGPWQGRGPRLCRGQDAAAGAPSAGRGAGRQAALPIFTWTVTGRPIQNDFYPHVTGYG